MCSSDLVTGLGKSQSVTATIDGIAAPVSVAGPEGAFPGIEIVRMEIPKQLAGRGRVNVAITADGRESNSTYIVIK